MFLGTDAGEAQLFFSNCIFVFLIDVFLMYIFSFERCYETSTDLTIFSDISQTYIFFKGVNGRAYYIVE